MNPVLTRFVNFGSSDLVTSGFEPPHDKTGKMTVHQVKTQIRLGIGPV